MEPGESSAGLRCAPVQRLEEWGAAEFEAVRSSKGFGLFWDDAAAGEIEEPH